MCVRERGGEWGGRGGREGGMGGKEGGEGRDAYTG